MAKIQHGTQIPLRVLLAAVLCATLYAKTATAWGAGEIIPAAKLSIRKSGGEDIQIYAESSASAGWGAIPAQDADQSEWKKLIEPREDSTGCDLEFLRISVSQQRNGSEKFYLVVTPGGCTFPQKARLAQAVGASGLIIRNTIQAIYYLANNNNNSSESGRNALSALAYSCDKGRAYVDRLATLPWDTYQLPSARVCNQESTCASKICLPTGEIQQSQFELCCMWDRYFVMSGGKNVSTLSDIKIPAYFLTVADGTTLLQSLPAAVSDSLRPRVTVDASSFVLWLLGTITAWSGAYYAAAREKRVNTPASAQYQRLRSPTQLDKEERGYGNATAAEAPAEGEEEEETLELTMYHAAMFIVMASACLLLIFYIHAAIVVNIIFAFGSATTLSVLVVTPILDAFLPKKFSTTGREFPVLGYSSYTDIMGTLGCLALAAVWFAFRKSDWAWGIQDMFGVCLCFAFLSTVRVPNLKVATLLLTLAFLYDVFFVFISGLIFKESVMIAVATGGNPASSREYPGDDYCDRYPDDSKCQLPEQIAMLLKFPRLMDWLPGYAMLGLGDIILPGLLLTFALRYDFSLRKPLFSPRGYFLYLALGYTIGLMLCNAMVYVMKSGQPALFYIVPLTLGPLYLLGYIRSEVRDLWNGPPSLTEKSSLTEPLSAS